MSGLPEGVYQCPLCNALVADLKKHTRWHESLDRPEDVHVQRHGSDVHVQRHTHRLWVRVWPWAVAFVQLLEVAV